MNQPDHRRRALTCGALVASLSPVMAGAAGPAPWVGLVLAAALAALLYARSRRRGSGTSAATAEEPAAPEPAEDAPAPPEEARPPAAAARLGPGWVDESTGLPNARYLREKFSDLRDTGPAPPPLTLLTINVERVPGFDPSTGKVQGDRALAEVAQTVRGILRAGDTCALGADGHLMAVLPGLDPETSGTLVARVKQAVASMTLVTHSDGEIQLGVAVGRAFMPKDGDSLDALLDAAHRDLERSRTPSPPGNNPQERLSRAIPLISN